MLDKNSSSSNLENNIDNSENLNKSVDNIDSKISEKEQKILDNISNEYGIQHSNLEKLATFKTSKGIEGLKKEIESQKIESLKEISDSKLENLLDAISKYQEEIKNESKSKLDELKNETSFFIKKNNSVILSKLSDKNIEKYITNPKNILDNTIGGIIGLISSGEKILQTTFDIGKGIILLPRDLYNLATGKARYNRKI